MTPEVSYGVSMTALEAFANLFCVGLVDAVDAVDIGPVDGGGRRTRANLLLL
jgi:hypothetical protein